MLIAARTTPRGALLQIPISLMFVTLLKFFDLKKWQFVHCQSKQFKTIKKKPLHGLAIENWSVKSNVEMRIAHQENECRWPAAALLKHCYTHTKSCWCKSTTTSDSFILSHPWISFTFSSCPFEARSKTFVIAFFQPVVLYLWKSSLSYMTWLSSTAQRN